MSNQIVEDLEEFQNRQNKELDALKAKYSIVEPPIEPPVNPPVEPPIPPPIDPPTEPSEGVVYVNNFDNLDGLILEAGNGTVTTENPIGSVVLPQKALTIENTKSGNCYAAIDLGASYNELYIQYYISVIERSDANGYKDNLQVGEAVNGLEACEIKMSNNSNPHTRPYGLPNYQALAYMGTGTTTRIGMHVNKSALTCDFYADGKFIGQKTINNRELRYITLGGNNVSGYKLQFSALTVNSLGFMNGVPNIDGIGEYETIYVDSSMDESIDTTNFSGKHKELFDPKGDGVYTDGAKRFLSNAKMIGDSGKTLFKRGLDYKLKDLNTAHKLYRPKTNTDDNFIIGAYGSGDLPNLDSSVLADPNGWELYDSANYIYKQSFEYTNRIKGAFIDENIGMVIEVPLSELQSKSGRMYWDSNNVYIRMWDDSNPKDHTIDILSNQGTQVPSYSLVSDIRFRFGSLAMEVKSIAENCEATLGAGFNAQNYGIVRDCHVYKQWGGMIYDPNTTGSGTKNGINIGKYGQAYYNLVEDCYIGIEIEHSSVNGLCAFNVVKNSIVSSIEVGGGAGGSSAEFPVRIINNTVFASPRHITNNPYPLPIDQPGHGIVVQSGRGDAYYEVLNNLVLLHYNQNNQFNGNPNAIHLGNQESAGIVDNNKYYISENSDDKAILYSDDSDRDKWIAHLDNLEWVGLNNGIPDNKSYSTNVKPVIKAESTQSSGKWLDTEGTPTETGGGHVYDFSEFGITKNLSGDTLTNNRNIGAY